MKFAANHAVTQVDQARPGILFDFAPRLFQRFQDDDTLRLFNFLHAAGTNIKDGRRAPFRFVESLAPARKYFLDDRRNGPAFFLHLSGECFYSNRVHHFEGSEFPSKAPTHRAVHIHDAVGNLRHAARGVQAHLREASPNKLLSLIALLPFEERPHQRAQPLARIFNCLARFE